MLVTQTAMSLDPRILEQGVGHVDTKSRAGLCHAREATERGIDDARFWGRGRKKVSSW